jgi:LysR family nitrogen assimilation transcriptional regulator
VAFRGSLQDIRLFVAAYEEKSFTAAAQRENSTQSGVSHHIRQLEMLLDVKLFVRERAGVSATPVADLLYRHFLDLLRGLDQASIDVEQYKGGLEGSLTVGIIPALTHRIAAPALLRFNALHPNVKVRIVEGYSSILPGMVASDDVDFAICTLHGSAAGVKARTLFTSPECLASRYDPEDDGPWPSRPINIIWASGMEQRRTSIIATLAARGVEIASSFEVDSALASLDLVSRSDWRMVNPLVMFDPGADADKLRIRPLDGLAFEVMLLRRTSTQLPPEAEAFATIMVEEAERARQSWDAVSAQRGRARAD